MKLRRYTDDEFEEYLKFFKNFDKEDLRPFSNNKKGYYFIYNSVLTEVMSFRYSLNQFKKLVDTATANPDDHLMIMKLFSLIENDEDFIKKCIPLKGYEYFVKILPEKINVLDFEDNITRVLFFMDEVYSNGNDQIAFKLEKITLKYLDLYPFENEDILIEAILNLNRHKYKYRGYNNIFSFNAYLDELSEAIGGNIINVDDFKLEDNIEDYLWEQEN